MLLLKDGVKYLPYEYTSEEELTQMVIEHYKEAISNRNSQNDSTVFGFGVDEINRILDYLYPALANEIQQPIKHSCKDNN